MTRAELLKHLLHQARGNGFELRRWFRNDAALPWPGADAAVSWLCQGARVHLLLCSHAFARALFGGSERLRHIQPATSFRRTAHNGVTRVVHRRAYPRTSRYDEVWQYHLQRMMASTDPLRYAQKFLISAETLQGTNAPAQLPPPLTAEPDYDEELLVREEG